MGPKHENSTKIYNQNLCRWRLIFEIGEMLKNNNKKPEML